MCDPLHRAPQCLPGFCCGEEGALLSASDAPHMIAGNHHRRIDNLSDLSIRNATIYNLARELSALTGESMTMAVREALRERLERIRSTQRIGLSEHLMAIGKDCAARMEESSRMIDHGDLLYNKDGLPQ